MNSNFESKSQISIFILTIIIVIFLFIFLFSSNFENKKTDLKKSKTQILSETNNKLFPLKDNVDYCLKRQVKKALIISGMHGGFIYDKGEYYSPSVILQDTYHKKLVTNLDLNWNNLIEKVLIQSDYSVYVPNINNNGTIYTHTIKEDYEKFILDEFLKCINLDKYKSAGYKIIQEEYVGNIKKTIGPKKAEINKIIGKVNDKVRIVINGVEYL